jgi:hypothetical protein
MYYFILTFCFGLVLQYCFSETTASYNDVARSLYGNVFPILQVDYETTDYSKVMDSVLMELRTNKASENKRKISVELLTRYFEQLYTQTEMSFHVPYLHAIAQQSSSILELGTGKDFRASWGFLRGLAENDNVASSGKKLMVGVDLMDIPETDMIQRIAKEHDIEYHFHQANDLELPIKEMYGMFDLTFIDTWHCYGQLHRELKIFPAMTRKFLIFHDVNIDGVYGEDLRVAANMSESVARSGFSYAEIAIGLRAALNTFMAENPNQWRPILWTDDAAGLAILERIQPLLE